MRKPEPQVDEGGQQPVGEDQLLLTARPSRPAPGTPRAARATRTRVRPSTWARVLGANRRNVRGRPRTGQDGSRLYGPRSASQLT
jgi:hypothetical protein